MDILLDFTVLLSIYVLWGSLFGGAAWCIVKVVPESWWNTFLDGK